MPIQTGNLPRSHSPHQSLRLLPTHTNGAQKYFLGKSWINSSNDDTLWIQYCVGAAAVLKLSERSCGQWNQFREHIQKEEKNEWNLIPWRHTAGSHFKREKLHLILIVRHLRITAPVKEMATHFKTKQKSNNLYWKASNSVILKAELPWPTIHQRHHHHQHQRYNDHIKKVTTIPVRELPTDFRRRNLHPTKKKLASPQHP